jgi:hypothetical protein
MTAAPEDDHPLHAGIHAKLAEVAAALPTLPPWYEAWARLGPGPTGGERLAVYRAVRGAGSVPENAGFFLVAWVLDVLTDERAEAGLREADERLGTIRQKYGLGEMLRRVWGACPTSIGRRCGNPRTPGARSTPRP